MLIHYLYLMDYFMYVYIEKNLKNLPNTRMLYVLCPIVQEKNVFSPFPSTVPYTVQFPTQTRLGIIKELMINYND